MSTTSFKNEFGVFFIDKERDVKIVHSFEETGSHQKKDIELLYSFLKPEDVVVDIGAHIGTFSIPLSRFVREVYAIEPIPETFSLLQKNLEENKITNVRAIHSAVSDKEETLVAEETPNRAGTTLFSSREGRGMSAKPLDKLIPTDKKIALIKIDVEGMELPALLGARKIIRRDKPLIFLEINTPALTRHAVSRGRLERFLRSEGYLFFRGTERVETMGDRPELARIWTLYQGYFFDCLAVPKGKAVFSYFPPLPYFLWQVGRKINHVLRF